MNTGFYISDSIIKGRGLFASNDFKLGEIILNYRNYFWYKTKWSDLSKKQISKSWYIKSDNKDYCWVCDDVIWFGYLNHSRTPNARWNINKLRIVAARHINKNEELTIDYRLEERPTREKWPDWI